MFNSNEPVRRTAWLIGFVVILLQSGAALAGGVDWRVVVAGACTDAAAFILTGEVARKKVVGPETYSEQDPAKPFGEL